jgi:hypothetical protein
MNDRTVKLCAWACWTFAYRPFSFGIGRIPALSGLGSAEFHPKRTLLSVRGTWKMDP